MIRFNLWYLGGLLLGALLLVDCSPEVRQQLTPVPSSYGPTNQVIVVADKELWEGAVGDTFRTYFSSAYPVLPQPEPIFDLKHFAPIDLQRDPLRKELRNYVFLADLGDNDSPTTKWVVDDVGSERSRSAKADPDASSMVGQDKWAKNQLVVYLFGHGEKVLSEQIIRAFPAVKRRIDKANSDKVDATVYLDGENNIVKEEVMNTMGFRLRVPGDYVTALNEENTIWLRRENSESSANLMIHKEAYTDKEQLTRNYLKQLRDSLGKKYVSSEIPGTYMRTNDIDLPMIVEKTSLNGNYAIEARGVWELVNDYMGGPFVSYVVVNPKSQELVFVDGFIHAPGRKKREYMQGLEHLIRTIRF